MGPFPIIALGFLAFLAQNTKRTPKESVESSSPESSGSGESGPGWYSDKPLNLAPNGYALLNRLGKRLLDEKILPVKVNSGRRSSLAQANAMLEKVRRGGISALDIYKAKNVVIELLASGRDPLVWAGIIDRYASQGTMLSRHQTGLAFDLRTVDRPDTIAVRMRDILREEGAVEALLEDDPKHLHASA